VLTDEIYEHLVYGTARFSSLPVVAPEAAERCVVVNGPSKTYAMTGWRVGWMIAPAAVTQAAIRFQSHAASNVANVCQAATLAALEGPMTAMEGMRAAFDRRRVEMHRLLAALPGCGSPSRRGAFYAFPDVTGLLGRDLGGGDRAATDTELRRCSWTGPKWRWCPARPSAPPVTCASPSPWPMPTSGTAWGGWRPTWPGPDPGRRGTPGPRGSRRGRGR